MDALLKTSDVMEFMKISRSTLYRLTQSQDFPKPMFLFGMKRWCKEELESWLSTRREQMTAPVSPEC